jgi:CBS-domain-containing membrane protein
MRHRAIPITDDNDRMLGVVTYRDVVGLKHRYVE